MKEKQATVLILKFSPRFFVGFGFFFCFSFFDFAVVGDWGGVCFGSVWFSVLFCVWFLYLGFFKLFLLLSTYLLSTSTQTLQVWVGSKAWASAVNTILFTGEFHFQTLLCFFGNNWKLLKKGWKRHSAWGLGVTGYAANNFGHSLKTSPRGWKADPSSGQISKWNCHRLDLCLPDLQESLHVIRFGNYTWCILFRHRRAIGTVSWTLQFLQLQTLPFLHRAIAAAAS